MSRAYEYIAQKFGKDAAQAFGEKLKTSDSVASAFYQTVTLAAIAARQALHDQLLATRGALVSQSAAWGSAGDAISAGLADVLGGAQSTFGQYSQAGVADREKQLLANVNSAHESALGILKEQLTTLDANNDAYQRALGFVTAQRDAAAELVGIEESERQKKAAEARGYAGMSYGQAMQTVAMRRRFAGIDEETFDRMYRSGQYQELDKRFHLGLSDEQSGWLAKILGLGSPDEAMQVLSPRDALAGVKDSTDRLGAFFGKNVSAAQQQIAVTISKIDVALEVKDRASLVNAVTEVVNHLEGDLKQALADALKHVLDTVQRNQGIHQ
jgi:hypothetical protein